MDNFFLIDFNDFSPSQICTYVIERIHAKFQEKIIYLNNIILSNSLKKNVFNTAFHNTYLSLVDNTNRLIQLEQKILFEFIKHQSEVSNPLPISSSSKTLIMQFQYEVKKELLHTRALFQELEKNANMQTLTSIIEMELLNLETLITQWFHIVTRNILFHKVA